jgi:hypothetical protein
MSPSTMFAPRPASLLSTRSFSADTPVTGSMATPPATSSSHHNNHSVHFPHLRAVLAQLSRQYRTPNDIDDGTDDGRVDPALVSKVFTLLDEEQEEALQALLKEAFDIGDSDEVLSTCSAHRHYHRVLIALPNAHCTC